MRYELSDNEWGIIRAMLPTKPRGIPRVDDRRVLNGIFWVLRSGAPWRDLPTIYGPRTTCYNRFVRWRRAGIWDRILQALTRAHDAAVQMIDTSMVRVHQHACIADSGNQAVGRSRGGLTSKLHVVVDGKGLPLRLGITAGQVHDNRLFSTLLRGLTPRTMVLADRGSTCLRSAIHTLQCTSSGRTAGFSIKPLPSATATGLRKATNSSFSRPAIVSNSCLTSARLRLTTIIP